METNCYLHVSFGNKLLYCFYLYYENIEIIEFPHVSFIEKMYKRCTCNGTL
jgi:hypothetical protein